MARGKRRMSIMRRWTVNSLGAIALVLLLFAVIFVIAIRSNYYKSVEYLLAARADNLTAYLDMLAAADNSAALSQAASFNGRAGGLAEGFEDREQLELQILDASGRVFVSSSGVVQETVVPEDFKKAQSGADARGVWQGRNEKGEHIMALSVLRRSDSGEIIGCLRFITSLEPVNTQILLLTGLVALVCCAVVLFVMLSSTYFINSIVRPVAEVNRTARNIALGDYNARIVKYADDEIGDLCDTINYMAGEISAAEQMKNDFISSVSHELRTPLTAIKGWAETIHDGADDNGLTGKGLSVIIRESERLSGIVEELLDFSRIQSDRFTMRFDRVDVFAELSEAVVLMNDSAQRGGITLRLIESEPLPAVTGDGSRLKQVFINLIDNAVKYSDKGGDVRIECANMGAYIQIVISDTGIGIASRDLPRVKDKFFKSSNARPGSGIGLALVEQIMRLHKGSVSIESEEGEGTTVILTIPAESGYSRAVN